MFSSRVPAGMLFLVAGVVIGLVAMGIIAVDEELLHAPRWVIGLLAALFFAGGLAMLVGPGTSLAQWSAGTIVVSMTIVSAWVSLYGASEHFSGDWPLLSKEANVLIARILFGAVAFLGLGIMVGAVKKSWRS